MVDLLWRDGNPDAAILLEDLWNDLAATQRFTLLCGYGMRNFDREAHAIQFEEICRRHRRVIPTERWQRGTDEAAQLREICLLQQRAQALETEVVHRRGLERTLREALAERERLLALEQTGRADAEAAGRLKDEFLAVLSHELRTPLNAILGWTQIALDARTDSQTVRRAQEIIQRNAALRRHIVEDLLDLSRILTGKLRVSAEPVDLSEILTAAVDTVRPAAVAKTIELNLDVSRPVSDVMGDKDRLQQVMWNLLSNAGRRPIGPAERARRDRGGRFGRGHSRRFSSPRVRQVPSGRHRLDPETWRARAGARGRALPGRSARRYGPRRKRGRGSRRHVRRVPADLQFLDFN